MRKRDALTAALCAASVACTALAVRPAEALPGQCWMLDGAEQEQCQRLEAMEKKLERKQRELEEQLDMQQFKADQMRDCLIFWSARDCNWIVPR